MPPAGEKFIGLESGAKYKFLVTASHPDTGESQTSVVVETLSKPEEGQLKVTLFLFIFSP